MKKRMFVVVLLIAVLFLVACQPSAPGDTPLDMDAALEQVQTGTEGIEISLVPNYPPPLIYDQNELIALLEVKNKGNQDVDQRDCFVQISGFDPSIVRNFGTPRSCAENLGGVLEGKNIYNVEGSFNQLEFRAPRVTLPPDIFEYEPTLNFLTCYTYHTKANPSVCVDPLFYQITSDQKACTAHDVSMGGGQGAPVGVTYVGVDMVGSRAIFEINIRNLGSGRVLSPLVSLQDCSQSLDFDDLDRVRYSVRLGGSNVPGNCNPRDGFVRLNNDQGKIICRFDISGTTTYETPLQVDLDYSYMDSFTKSIKIISTPE